MKRWWIFLGERFPLVSHTLMIASFTLANMAFGLTIYPPAGAEGLIASVEWTRMFIAFFVALSFFLRLRLFDEIKDYETDLKINPTRPLARGLISISEVKIAIAILCIFELGLLTALSPLFAITHLLAMGYSFAMYLEFFVGKLIRPLLTTYAVLHTLVSVLIGSTISSVVTGVPFWKFSSHVWLLLLANWAYFNLFEFARKTFAPLEERDGVESYSKIFSIRGAVMLSLSQALIPIVLVSQVAGADFTKSDNLILWGLLILVVAPAFAFSLRPRIFAAKMFRNMVGLYLICGYLGLAWILGS